MEMDGKGMELKMEMERELFAVGSGGRLLRRRFLKLSSKVCQVH